MKREPVYTPHKNCPKCGGLHYPKWDDCPYTFKPCVICGKETHWACSDCAIDSGGKEAVHVCENPVCQKTHEEKHAAERGPVRDGGDEK
jgi:hypothetical protein